MQQFDKHGLFGMKATGRPLTDQQCWRRQQRGKAGPRASGGSSGGRNEAHLPPRPRTPPPHRSGSCTGGVTAALSDLHVAQLTCRAAAWPPLIRPQHTKQLVSP